MLLTMVATTPVLIIHPFPRSVKRMILIWVITTRMMTTLVRRVRLLMFQMYLKKAVNRKFLYHLLTRTMRRILILTIFIRWNPRPRHRPGTLIIKFMVLNMIFVFTIRTKTLKKVVRYWRRILKKITHRVLTSLWITLILGMFLT